MPGLLEHLLARAAWWHASRVYARFRAALGRPGAIQRQVLRRVLRMVAGSEFGRRHDLGCVRTPADLRKAVPLATYEDYRPLVARLCEGDFDALLSPGQRVVMFATSSGTTAARKLVPVTPAFVADYRRGWNTFGLKMLTDHPHAMFRAILQSSGRHDAERTRAGIPCGAITGLMAATQKRIVRRYYVGRPQIAHLEAPQARYYTLMRLAMMRDVGFAVTANPSTLIQMARLIDEHSEILIRDVRDGTLCTDWVSDVKLHAVLASRLRPAPERARALEEIRRRAGALRPRDYWNVAFLACWTGGSLGHYLPRLADWWGPVPVRDIGLLASEGRVSIPLQDDTAVGALDVTSNVYEFIPAELADDPCPPTVWLHELETGRDYVVVLSNMTGLVRYRLDDVVRVRGRIAETPLIEFIYRAGRVASVAGEKLTEHQVVAAARAACEALGIRELDFILAPCWGDPPYYRLTAAIGSQPELAATVDRALCAQNEEYESRRKSMRLGQLQLRTIAVADLAAMDARLVARRGSTAEQYKRTYLFTEPGADDRALGATTQIHTSSGRWSARPLHEG